MKDIDNDKKWKQAFQCFISIKLPQKQIQAVIDVAALQSPTPSSIQLHFSKKLFYLESQISCIVLQVSELSKSHCISHCGGGFHTPWKLHPKATGFPGKFSTYFKRLRLCKKNKGKKLEITLIKIRESRPLMWLFAVPQLKVLTFPIAFPALFLAVATAFCNKINKPNLAATNSSLQVLTLPYPGLARFWCWVRFFSGCCCPDWCWVPGVTGQ